MNWCPWMSSSVTPGNASCGVAPISVLDGMPSIAMLGTSVNPYCEYVFVTAPAVKANTNVVSTTMHKSRLTILFIIVTPLENHISPRHFLRKEW